MFTEEFWKYFFEIYEDLPRQGPGDRESTERALAMLPPLGANLRILDIGCGTGTQTIDLARATAARIVAVDSHAPFIARLQKSAEALGLARRITASVGDMNDLRFPDGSFDVLWSEGAIFIIGFQKGLAAWRRLLVPGGHLVVSDFCWFCESPPAELREFFLDDSPDVGGVAIRRKAVAEAGYRLVGDFPLPERGWWENYHVPLAVRLERFRHDHAGEPEALAVAEHCQREIDLFRKHRGLYGYVFFVMRAE
ncbi:MAG: class I SAM-dependent methyltransferase [Myxococcales bacterium]|nr:class I SAM-dependent methyltransferase [Myxococcales bacterium]